MPVLSTTIYYINLLVYVHNTHHPMGRPGTILPVTMNVHTSAFPSITASFHLPPWPSSFRGQVHLVMLIQGSSLGVPISFECPRCNVFVWVDLRRIDFESVGRGGLNNPCRISVYPCIPPLSYTYHTYHLPVFPYIRRHPSNPHLVPYVYVPNPPLLSDHQKKL